MASETRTGTTYPVRKARVSKPRLLSEESAAAMARPPSAEEMRRRQEAISAERRTVPVPEDLAKAQAHGAPVVSDEPEAELDETEE